MREADPALQGLTLFLYSVDDQGLPAPCHRRNGRERDVVPFVQGSKFAAVAGPSGLIPCPRVLLFYSLALPVWVTHLSNLSRVKFRFKCSSATQIRSYTLDATGCTPAATDQRAALPGPIFVLVSLMQNTGFRKL